MFVYMCVSEFKVTIQPEGPCRRLPAVRTPLSLSPPDREECCASDFAGRGAGASPWTCCGQALGLGGGPAGCPSLRDAVRRPLIDVVI